MSNNSNPTYCNDTKENEYGSRERATTIAQEQRKK